MAQASLSLHPWINSHSEAIVIATKRVSKHTTICVGVYYDLLLKELNEITPTEARDYLIPRPHRRTLCAKDRGASIEALLSRFLANRSRQVTNAIAKATKIVRKRIYEN